MRRQLRPRDKRQATIRQRHDSDLTSAQKTTPTTTATQRVSYTNDRAQTQNGDTELWWWWRWGRDGDTGGVVGGGHRRRHGGDTVCVLPLCLCLFLVSTVDVGRRGSGGGRGPRDGTRWSLNIPCLCQSRHRPCNDHIPLLPLNLLHTSFNYHHHTTTLVFTPHHRIPRIVLPFELSGSMHNGGYGKSQY